MTANAGFPPRGTAAFSATFTAAGANLDLEKKMNGTTLLPRCWKALSNGNYVVTFNAKDEQGGTAYTCTIPALAGMTFDTPPHQLGAASTVGVVMYCEYGGTSE